MSKYFKRNFKTIAGIRLALLLKRPYDWVRLNLDGEKILRQEYHIYNRGCVIPITDGSGKYKIWNMIWTQNMIDDLKEIGQPDVVADLEEMLVKELEKKQT